ncbi:MAG: sugar transporter, partial [Rhizobiaceae bacterium]|nr:sugar transporter [Rhizobiaceae bacterium]
MSSSERSKRLSQLQGWQGNEPSEGQREVVRLRSPIVRPRDFVQEVDLAAAPEKVEAVEKSLSVRDEAESKVAEIDRKIEAMFRAPEQPVAEPVAAAPVATEPVAAAPAIVEPVVIAPPPVKPASVAVPAADAPLLDLRSAMRAIWGKKFVVLALAVVGAVGGAAVIPLLPQKFTAETSIYFDPRQMSASDSAQGTTTAPELISTLIDSQTQIFSSGRVLGRVVDALKLDQDSRFNGGATGDAAKYVATMVLSKAIVIAREAGTYVVSMKVTTRDPQKSADIANQLVSSFIEEESKAAATSYKTSNTALDSRLEDLRQQVLVAEKAVEDYRADNDMVAVEG